MSFHMDQDEKVIVPVSKMDGMQAVLDGREVPMGSFENLMALQLPAGQHQLELTLKKTRVYILGKYVSMLSVLLVFIG
ncbi:MAG: hypothetical protein U9N81_04455 [Bacillota bacterium]|nr:hypothetical protein [Bacillota bacterium]